MSSRVTRSSARLSTGSSNPPPPAQSSSTPAAARSTPSTSKKRKAVRDPTPEAPEQPEQLPNHRQLKRTKASERDPSPSQVSPASARPLRRTGRGTTAMSSAGTSSDPTNETPLAAASTSKRKSSRKKANTQESAISTTTGPSQPSKKTKKPENKHESPADKDTTMQSTSDVLDSAPAEPAGNTDGNELSEDDGPPRTYDQDEQDIFASHYLSQHRVGSSLADPYRSMGSSYISSVPARLRENISRLKEKDDPTIQLIALQDLSELLLMSNEDVIQGHFSPDQCVKELVTLMQPSELGGANLEMMLLACRCLAHLMEALPQSTANVVYGGAVPILCQKLFDPEYIDLAEQALSTLEKISVEFPSTIVREGGLAGCLNLLDFFPTSTQRTAVTIAANCCRKIPEDSFNVIRDAMQTLQNVLGSSDQKVVEKASLCVSGIVDSFGYQNEKLEELVSTDLLRTVLRFLLPGTTNLIGPNIHTQFLRVLSITARASPRLSAELLKMDIVDTLYQILTGVSPPAGTEDVALKIDKNVIMQALVHRPREQVFETLNVICELLPSVDRDELMFLDDLFDAGYPGSDHVPLSTRGKDPLNDKRLSVLKECKEELKRFAIILLPTLTEAYSSTVNLSVRQKVLTAQLKMLSNLDTNILEDALRVVPYASYLASILSQEDHPSLVTYALQAAELLLKRLGSIYRYQFYREGVISEIFRLANRSLSVPQEKTASFKDNVHTEAATTASNRDSISSTEQAEGGEAENDVLIEADQSDEEDDDEDNDDGHDDVSASSGSSRSSEQAHHIPPPMPNLQDITTLRAKKFIEAHEANTEKGLKQRATNLLSDMRALADDIRSCYLGQSGANGRELFARLADYFDGDALESITSYELLSSGIVEALLGVFAAPKTLASIQARSTFLEVFMRSRGLSNTPPSRGATSSTPFSILVQKLQDLLSRAEHFEVITVHQNSFDSNRSSPASMLAKQLKLKLIADDESGIHENFRIIMVAIHAIATFKALDDYLRPRISSPDDPKYLRRRAQIPGALGPYATTVGMSGQRPRVPEGTLTPSVPTLPFASSNIPGKSAKVSKISKPSTPPSSTKTPAEPVRGQSSNLRRSTRKHSALLQTPPRPPPTQSPEEESSTQEPLECADETRFSDDEDEDDGRAALGAVLDDMADPGAVNMEVTDGGNKVTARQEDGTRIPTPSQISKGAALARQSLLNHSPSSRPGASTPASSLWGAKSFAEAVQSTPQDWHLEFSVNDQPIPSDTTIYRVVHFSQTNEFATRTVWSNTHTIKFKRVSGPPPEFPSVSPPPDANSANSDLPQSLDKNPITSAILRLLSILHELNANIDDVLAEGVGNVKLAAEPLAQFVNTKLTAKLNRQLEEPLIVASNCLPTWSEDLARFHPFLFPFETRHLFLQSTSFGYSRSMSRWQSATSTSDSRHDRHRDERQFLGRLQRQKVRISRSKMFESAIKVMDMYGSSPSMLEVEYFEEVGTGLGPTLEFYSTVSKEFARKRLKLWRESEANDSDEFAFGKRGLFPAPMSVEQAQTKYGMQVLEIFKTLGKFVARSMLDSRIIDVSFNPTFFRVGEGSRAVAPSLGAVASVDEQLANSLKMLKLFASIKQQVDEDTTLSPAQKVQKIRRIEVAGTRVEDMGLDFTLPGYPSIELCENGSNTPVTIDNVDAYVDSVVDFTLGRGVQKQVESFRAGFTLVFPYTALRAFTPDELVMLFGRTEEDWSLETLLDSVKADHGYNLDSRSVRNLLQTMSEFALPARRDFLQFVTGSPKLPIGGFKSLTPLFTVVCKPSEPPYVSDDYLPSVMTCVNYLKLPDYSSQDVLRERLGVAIKDGQGAFHLS